MLKRHWIEDLSGWEGFSYLKLKGVPMKKSKNGGAIDFDEIRLAKLVAKKILESRVPIRGKELKLLRSVTRLSLNRCDSRHESVEVIITNKKPTSKRKETKLITRPSYRGHRTIRVKI